jgi:ABC-type transport system substrate-binding protein
MNREIVVGLLKITLLGVLAVLLLIRIFQEDAVEARLLDIQAVVERRGQGDAIEALDRRTQGIERSLHDFRDSVEKRLERVAAEGVRAVPTGDVVAPPAERGVGGPGAADPRTLPYWPSEDNLLVDLSREPYPPEDAPRGGILQYYTQHNPTSFNEHVNNDAELQERICGPVYEYLATQSRADPDQWVPGLANRVTANADFTEFTCHIRKGVYWHKPFVTPEEKRSGLGWLDDLPPQEMTADDVKFTFDIVRDPLSECGSQLSYLGDIEEVRVVDRYTVKVLWKRSRYYNKATTLNLLLIFPKFIYERGADGKVLDPAVVAPTFPQHWFNNKMCGTGPFMFAGFEPNQVIKLRRNDGWWDPRKPALDGIDIRVVTEPPVQMAMFKAGTLDVYPPYPNDYRAEILEGGPGSVKEMVEKGTASVIHWQMFTYYFIAWNFRVPQLKDVRVRRALAHLYPKERVIRDIYFGLAVPHDSPVHPFENCYDKELEQFPYDPAAAAKLLDEAGWRMNARGVREKVVDGELRELKIRLLYPSQSPVARDTALLYQTSAQPAGVLIEPFPREWTVMEKMLEDKDLDAAMLGWGNVWDSDPSQIWHSESALSAKGSNFISYMSPELDAVIESLRTTFDLAKRQEIWKEFQRIIVRDQPYCFTHIRTRTWFVNNRLGNHYFGKLRPQDWFLPWYVKAGK